MTDTNFPASIDAIAPLTSTSRENGAGTGHWQRHNFARAAILALQNKVGVDGSTVETSLDYRVNALEETLAPDLSGITTELADHESRISDLEGAGPPVTYDVFTTEANGLVPAASSYTPGYPKVLNDSAEWMPLVDAHGMVVLPSSPFIKSADDEIENIPGLAIQIPGGVPYRFSALLFLDIGDGGGQYALSAEDCDFIQLAVTVWTNGEHSQRRQLDAASTNMASNPVCYDFSASGYTGWVEMKGVVQLNATGNVCPMFAQANASDSSSVTCGYFEVQAIG